MLGRRTAFILMVIVNCCSAAMSQGLMNGSAVPDDRALRYHPEGSDFVITNGNRRFTRALYGSNTAFRVEAGDLPEFAMYLPGMGGNIQFGLIKNDSSKWLIRAQKITARYRPGSMRYIIEDSLFAGGTIELAVLALADREGAIVKIDFKNIAADVKLFWVYGGVSGKKFSRDGDMGPDPESVFYLKPEYCKGNRISIEKDAFRLACGNAQTQAINGIFPPASKTKLVNPNFQQSPLSLYNSTADSLQALAGWMPAAGSHTEYFTFLKQDSLPGLSYPSLPGLFEAAETARKKLADRIRVNTPDPYINTLGGALSMAAEAIWESPSFMHGAIGWRMRLNGWRGAYAADVLGWHDRARAHFRAYALSQVDSPATGKVVADTSLNLARQQEKMGTAVFSSGYISRNPGGDKRPHHYDMNLVFIDQLLWHFNWTGDTAFVREMWPLLKRHLAWEKRNFDPNDDGLYDAYAAIWASDALQYSGGAVTHSSAYNYRANKMAAMLADILQEDPAIYRTEAAKIIKAINSVLWMKDKGWYAEYKDALGRQQLHAAPAVWTIYHGLDSDIADPFQAYQGLQYIDHHIPHIPVRAKGLDKDYVTISTSNWMPYTWSLNNVALAELMHTSLAYWQGGRNETAFQLWKSALLESMYLGGSPGNFQQISTYDAARGEAYRDFADPVGMTARSLVQGLFGILPDALNQRMIIKPGFPAEWRFASLQTPDIYVDYKRTANRSTYHIQSFLPKKLNLELQVTAKGTGVKSVSVNGQPAPWKNIDTAIGMPMIRIDAGAADEYRIVIEWSGVEGSSPSLVKKAYEGEQLKLQVRGGVALFDPQQLFTKAHIDNGKLSGTISTNPGYKTAFIKMNSGSYIYWMPLEMEVKAVVEIMQKNSATNGISFVIRNSGDTGLKGMISVNGKLLLPSRGLTISNDMHSRLLTVPPDFLIPGSNEIEYSWVEHGVKKRVNKNIISWKTKLAPNSRMEPIMLDQYLNDKVTNIFKNRYLSPRPAVATLQLPTQGIGDWTHPKLTAAINDSGFRKSAVKDIIHLPQQISFRTPQDSAKNNIAFTSQWDNYPKEISIPLSGNANHIYFLMAGSTNPMQSQFINGRITVFYADGTTDSLELRNPENWWPIEQDYFDNGLAFKTNAAKPVRVHLQTGKIISTYDNSIAAFNGKAINGGAATVLDLPLQANKILKSLKLETVANDVVIGLMAATLIRP